MANPPDPEGYVQPDLGLPERYEVLRRIASGGMATVWSAHDRALGRRVAIKLLAERFADDLGANTRFLREARAAARLSGHPHVVMIYDVDETTGTEHPGRAFIVMEHLAGGTVADALRVEAVRLGEATGWLREAASAIDYAHAHGILHRDIKPANLLLDRARVLHVADFGIARLGTEDTITSTGQVIGTAGYLAPERALGRPTTAASDRYSLAVAAYEILVGARPFAARHFAAQARQHIEDEPPPASSRNRALPPSVDAVLARGMAKRPEDRWATAQDFAQALEAALTEPVTRPFRFPAAVAAPSPQRAAAGAQEAPRRRRTPGRRISALAALVAGAAIAAVVISSIGSGGQQRARVTGGVERPLTTARAPKPPVHHSRPRPRPQPSTTVAATQAAATTPPPLADTLEAHGHQLMEDGAYAAAIPVLRQAIAAASPGSLTYAYALYDLGRSLRLDGDIKDAVAVLYQRLQIPVATDAVRVELQLALQALGQAAQNSAAAHPTSPGSPGHGHHHGRPGASAPRGQGDQSD